jgi:hypothetical protein
MAVEVFANDGQATVTSGGTTAPAAGTVQTWTLSGSTLPAVSSSATPATQCYVCDPAAESEKILVTNISGTTATVTRGADGTTPVTHSAGFTVQQVLTRASLQAHQSATITLPPSGDTTGTADAAAISAAVTALNGKPGVIRLSPVAPWYVSGGTVVINASAQYIDAAGCVINAKGSGAVFDIHDTSTFGSRALHGGGLLGFPVIDGTSCTGNAYAVHMGDIFEAVCELQAYNFTAGTTSKGAWFDNRFWIGEALHAKVYTSNCTAGVVFDVSTGGTNNTGSFMRSVLDLQVNQVGPTFDGVVIQNGAFLQDAELNVRGNFGTSTSVLTSAALRVNGSTPVGTAVATNSNITNSVLNVACEVDTSSGTNAPYTINFGTGTNFIGSCTGNIDFGSASPFRSSNNGGQFSFVGVVAGDANLPVNLPSAITNVADGNQTISATTATAITSIALPVAAFVAYKVDLYLPHSLASATGTYTIALGGPSINAASLDVTLWSGTTATPTARNSQLSSGTLLSLQASATGNRALRLAGTIVFSASGTLTVTGLKSSGGANITVNAGSYLELTPMAAP